MAKQEAIQKELAALRTVLSRFPGGASIEAILSGYGVPISERTLQRRLVTLLQQGFIRTTGQGRALHYHLVTPTETAGDQKTEKSIEETSQATVPLSVEGQEIQRILQLPIGNRIPKGYDPSFLRNYRPNIRCLPDDSRAHPAPRTRDNDRAKPAGWHLCTTNPPATPHRSVLEFQQAGRQYLQLA